MKTIANTTRLISKLLVRRNLARVSALTLTMLGTFACAGAGASADAASPSNVAGLAASGDTMNIALKFVEFTDASGKPVLSQDEVKKAIVGINQLYSQCKIQFVLGEYVTADPAKYGLGFEQSSQGDMDKIRAPFDVANQLVVINTGAWNHGSMGSANAWTAMPGSSPSGAVLESVVATDDNITAHELGHYLGLDHVNDQSQMMSPIIYSTSTYISPNECATMRQVAVSDRAQALR
jgi:hypothetical protein